MEEKQLKLAEELLFSDKKKPGFAKLLYFGLFDAKQAFPYPKPDNGSKEETLKFLDTIDQFLDEHLDPEWIDRHQDIPHDVVKGMADLGLLGMTVPKNHGGLGMSQTAYCHATERVSRRCASTALFINAHQSIGLRALEIFGTDEQRDRWLIPMAKGEKLAAFALTEPNVGSDASAVETRAIYDHKKNIYRINGRKQWITNGGIADVLTVMAQTEVDTPNGKEEKITAFLVTPDMPGFKVINPSLEKVGVRGTKTGNLAFENMEVPAENILGKKGSGLKVALTVLDYGRLTFGALCNGVAKFCFEKSFHRAKTRVQFNKPLCEFPLVKQKLSKIAALAYAMDATLYLTTGYLDRGEEDIMVETAMVKVFTSEALWDIIYETMQIHGGRSYFTSEPFERLMRDARINMIGEGANEVLRAFIGLVGMRDIGVQIQEGLGALKNPFKNLGEATRFLRQIFQRFRLPQIDVQSDVLKPEASMLAKAIRRFGLDVLQVLKKYREGVVDEQLTLNRIASMALALYTSSAVISRADADLTSDEISHQQKKQDTAVAKFYIHDALRMFRHSHMALFTPFDREIENLSELLTQNNPS